MLSLHAAALPEAKPEDVGLSAQRLARIHAMAAKHIDLGDITGAVMLVARKGQVAYVDVQGVMDLESKKPVTRDTMFRIASMTKPVVGTAIMMLLEEGKLSVGDPVSKFIPEFKNLKVAVESEPGGGAAKPPKYYTVPAAREVTIKDLLTHTSGLASGPMGNSEAMKNPRKPTDTLADYIPRLAASPLEFQPGSRWLYSPGAAFDTLGRIVEIASGIPLAISQITNFNAFAGFGTQRPNLVADPNLPSGDRSVARYFNTAAFTTAPQFTIGSSSRNPLRGPGYQDADMMAGKTFPLADRMNLEFRAEAFNISNTPPLGAPNTVLGNAAFGTITTALDPRVFELALKLKF